MNSTKTLNIHETIDSRSGSESTDLTKSGFDQDNLNFQFLRILARLVVLALLALVFLLLKTSWPVLIEYGSYFVTSDNWIPTEDEFGALSFVYGTIITSSIAIFLAAPTSIAIALFINEILPKKLGKFLGFLIEMIAAVPSIVFGLWGLFALAPWIKDTLTPILKDLFGFSPFFQGPSFGIGILNASLILAIMITPTITSICREVFKTVPRLQKESALALGATKWEMVRIAILKPSFSGIMGGVVLGLGRALGETMAVAMVIGNNAQISSSIFAPAATMASVIANEYAEAESDEHLAALCLVGLLLFVVTITVNTFARVIVWQFKKENSPRKKKK